MSTYRGQAVASFMPIDAVSDKGTNEMLPGFSVFLLLITKKKKSLHPQEFNEYKFRDNRCREGRSLLSASMELHSRVCRETRVTV